MSRISFYKHKVEKAITHGYHEEPKGSGDDRFFKEFQKDREQLEKAVDEWIQIMSDQQKESWMLKLYNYYKNQVKINNYKEIYPELL